MPNKCQLFKEALIDIKTGFNRNPKDQNPSTNSCGRPITIA